MKQFTALILNSKLFYSYHSPLSPDIEGLLYLFILQ